MLLLFTAMNTDIDIFPLFVQLVEQRGDKTEMLIQEIKKLSERFNIYDDVTLATITASTTSSSDNVLIYQINTTPTSKAANATSPIEFLEYLFQKMFDKYPSYVEPPH